MPRTNLKSNLVAAQNNTNTKNKDFILRDWQNIFELATRRTLQEVNIIRNVFLPEL